MTKNKNKTVPVAATTTAEVVAVPNELRRVVVRLSEADWTALQAANGQGVTVTAFAAAAGKALSEAQRAARKAYRLRPEVQAKQRAYRSERAKRIRAAKAAAKAAAASAAPMVIAQ